jgi:hypothetical protein
MDRNTGAVVLIQRRGVRRDIDEAQTLESAKRQRRRERFSQR